MRYEVLLVIESTEGPQTMLLELVSHLESVGATVETGCVLVDGSEVATYDYTEPE